MEEDTSDTENTKKVGNWEKSEITDKKGKAARKNKCLKNDQMLSPLYEGGLIQDITTVIHFNESRLEKTKNKGVHSPQSE